jgi:hypothetical protein
VPGERRVVAGPLVVEGDGPAGHGRLPEHVERRLVGAEPRLGDVEGAQVEGEAGGRQLADGVRGRLGEPRVLPDLGGECHDGSLVGLQGDLGQCELVGPDPVARLVVEVGVHLAHLDRDPEAAQLLLVTLEHLLEGVVRGVGVEDRADPLLGDVVPLDEQHDEQVEQPLGLRRVAHLRTHLALRNDMSPMVVRRPRGCRPRSTACRCP